MDVTETVRIAPASATEDVRRRGRAKEHFPDFDGERVRLLQTEAVLRPHDPLPREISVRANLPLEVIEHLGTGAHRQLLIHGSSVPIVAREVRSVDATPIPEGVRDVRKHDWPDGVLFLSAIKHGQSLGATARAFGISKEAGYTILRRRYIELRRDGVEVAVIAAEMGLRSRRMPVWEEAVGRAQRHHLSVPETTQALFWEAFGAGATMAAAAAAAGAVWATARARASYGERMHARPVFGCEGRLRWRGLLALAAVVIPLSGCTADVPGPSPTSPIVAAARQDTRPLFDEAMAVKAVPGVREVARATEDWCFGEGGSDQIGETGSVVTTICGFGGGIVYAVDGSDQYAAAEAVDRFLATNGIHASGGRVVDSLASVDLLQSGDISGGGGRGLPGGGANGSATVRWTLVAASRLQIDGLPLPQGFNRQSYEGSITESTPADVRAMNASFALTVEVRWRYFAGTGNGSLPSS